MHRPSYLVSVDVNTSVTLASFKKCSVWYHPVIGRYKSYKIMSRFNRGF